MGDDHQNVRLYRNQSHDDLVKNKDSYSCAAAKTGSVTGVHETQFYELLAILPFTARLTLHKWMTLYG